MPWLLFKVTATWCHAPVFKVEAQLICCSPPLLLVVMANRNVPLPPHCGVRNI